MSTEKCGTYAGWNAHTVRGEKACDACREARNEYARDRRQKPTVRAREWGAIAARNRALRRLGREYPERLAELVAEEKARAS